MAFAVIEPARLPLDPPEQTDPLDDAYSGFTHVADRAVAHALLRTQPLDHARGHHYGDPDVSPDRTHTGRPPRTCRSTSCGPPYPHGARAVSAHSIIAEAAIAKRWTHSVRVVSSVAREELFRSRREVAARYRCVVGSPGGWAPGITPIEHGDRRAGGVRHGNARHIP